MSTSSHMSLLDELSIDELRWLEASEIVDFPTSPVDTFQFNDRVVPRFSHYLEGRQWSRDSSKGSSARTSRSSDRHPGPGSLSSLREHCPSPAQTQTGEVTRGTWSSTLPTPPTTPTRTRVNRTGVQQESPSEWLYRRPKNPVTPRGSPCSTSALSSSLTLHQIPSTKSLGKPQTSLSNATSTALTKLDEHERKSAKSKSGEGPFWSTVFRPRSRSVRSIPLLKTIPSELEVTLQPPSFPGGSDAEASNSSSSIIRPIRINRKPPSISSTLSSASSHSSSRPETPLTPSESLLSRGFHHRRYASNPSNSTRVPPLSASCPSKSILTRTSSISTTKDSISTANKSVKFVEVPTVHYASAGYWDLETVDRMDVDEGSTIDSMGMDIDSMDTVHKPRRKHTIVQRRSTRPYPSRGAVSRTDLSSTPELDDTQPETELQHARASSNTGFKRFMNLSRRSSVSTQRSAPPPPAANAPPTPPPKKLPRPSISGPYALGSHPPPPTPTSPAHSVTSFRSSTSKSKARFYPSSPASATISPFHGTGTSAFDNYCDPMNGATRSVRSLNSVKSASSHSVPGFKSWLSRLNTSRSES